MTKYHEDETIRAKIDKLLAKNSGLEASLGTDSSKKEYSNVKRKQDKLFDQIRDLDLEFYKIIVIESDRSN